MAKKHLLCTCDTGCVVWAESLRAYDEAFRIAYELSITVDGENRKTHLKDRNNDYQL